MTEKSYIARMSLFESSSFSWYSKCTQRWWILQNALSSLRSWTVLKYLVTPCVLQFGLVLICTLCPYTGSMCYLITLSRIYWPFKGMCTDGSRCTVVLSVLQVDYIQAYFESCITVRNILYQGNKAVGLVCHTSENIQNF